jgi:RNA polymerase subunit RPABC4/transcription elongation factor Spt4
MFLLSFVASYGPKITETIQQGIGPCTVTGCEGHVDQVMSATALSVFTIAIWTFTAEEVAHCPTCDLTMTAEDYERLCLPLITSNHAMNEEPVMLPCHKCGKGRKSDWKHCPYCNQTFLSV